MKHKVRKKVIYYSILAAAIENRDENLTTNGYKREFTILNKV